MKKIIILITFLIAIIALSCTPQQKACTEEAKQCPDGSFVGREGPNCEFKACPDIKAPDNGRSYFKTEPNCVINFMCVKGTTGFSDETGCGCEPVADAQVPDTTSPDDSNAGGTMPAGKLAAIECKKEQRNVGACTLEYMPVCGWAGPNIQCIKYPCAQTYGNICQACDNPNVEYYTEGECPKEEDLAKI